MRVEIVNKVCYTLCVISICGSALTGMLMVWADDFTSGWRVLMSFLILLLAAAAMIAINNALARGGSRE